MRLAVSLVFAVVLAAQAPPFGVQSRLVLVPVTVTAAKGHPVDGLQSEALTILDQGRPQKVTVDTTGTGVAPIALVVAIQTSGISRAVLEKVQKIGAMIQPIVTGDRGCAAVVSFSERIVWNQECTGDEDALARAFAQVHPGLAKSAHMLDAIKQANQRLEQHANSRRVLLLISESKDRGSETALAQTLIATQAAGVTVYAATYSAFETAFTSKSSATAEPHMHERPKTPSDESGTADGGPPRCNPNGCPDPPVPLPDQRIDLLGGIGELVRLGKINDAQALTKGTGRAIFPFARLKGLEAAIQKLGTELHSQYLLSFTPDDKTDGYHNLEVRVAGGEYRVRARPGYWSSQSSR